MFDPDDYELHEAQKHACKMARERDEARVMVDRLTEELAKCEADAYEAEYNAARILKALKAAAQFVETEQFPIGWSVDRIREVIAKVSGMTPNSN